MHNNIRNTIYQRNIKSATKIIVLDDDPTGCQTVHNIVLSFRWDTETLKKLISENDCFYILTNSRALPGREAYNLIAQICGNILDTGYPADRFRIICRTDSTLRGHFMEETKAIFDNLKAFDGLLVVPFFKEGGRITKDDTHYVIQDGKMIPANETEFAKDANFGYKNAWLPAWIEEKSDGFYRKENVISISLEEIRSVNYTSILTKLLNTVNGTPIIVNAMEDSDLDYFCAVLQEAEDQGKRFLYRTGASFVKIRAGIQDKSLHMPSVVNGAGLIVAGSYVNKTNAQINYLIGNSDIKQIELSIKKIISQRDKYKNEIISKTDHYLRDGKTVLVYTERELFKENDPDRQLLTGETISLFLAGIVSGLSEKPGFIVSKGGITSHQVALHGLKIQQAKVLGQILPGVPVIKTDSKAGIPDIDYIIFPGNVGSESAVYEVVKKYVN